jgi:D-sedoheptulose 7-phosphate isomerase
MKDFPGIYFKRLAELMDSTAVTDREGRDVGMEDGWQLACGLISRVEKEGRKVMFIGNGGSAGIASHMAIDFWKNGGISATAFNDPSLLTCIGNDYGYEHVFEKPVEQFGQEGDLLIAISSSGRSRNIILGVEAARKRNCGVITMSGFGEDNNLRTLGDINFYVSSGAYGPVEVIHQALCHCLLDSVMVDDGKLKLEMFTGDG